MAKHFVKLYGSILDSSVWAEDAETRLVWVTMLAMADENGHVEASVGGLSRRANVSYEGCAAAIEKFQAPDSDSKSQDFEGRRITATPGGWDLLNHRRYRDMRTTAQIKTAEKVAAWRAAQKLKPPKQVDESRDNTQFGQIYFIEQGDHVAIKIGFSSNPGARLAELQCGSPLPLRILACVEASRRQELRLHKQLDQYRLSGEWYRYEQAILDLIVTLRNRVKPAEVEVEAEVDTTTERTETDTRATTRERRTKPRQARLWDPWIIEAATDWEERFGKGTAPHGQIGASLAKLVKLYTWEAVRPAWQRYLTSKDPQYSNPADFAKRLMVWLDQKASEPAPASASPLTKEERTREALRKWLEDRILKRETKAAQSA